jgi:hypothetical protein
MKKIDGRFLNCHFLKFQGGKLPILNFGVQIEKPMKLKGGKLNFSLNLKKKKIR